MRKKRGLTKREILFCQYYARYGDPRRAAAKAGWTAGAERAGMLLLRREDIRQEICRAAKEAARLETARSGWERLAVGSISDAVRLLYHSGETPPECLEEMELLNVSEIKRPRGGGMEIKFFDRIKALEGMQQLQCGMQEESASFYAALERGAAALKEVGETDED